MSKTKLIPVSKLLNLKFFIPSYQRGYRWTEQQVKDLLNDINEFEPKTLIDSNERTWYCLQPLVVKRIDSSDSRLVDECDKEGWYEVIDGQQRLTTIYIILKMMKVEELPSIKYESRPESGDFLSQIESASNDQNIDFHFMLKAREEIKNFDANDSFVNKLLHFCKIIWYETDDNAYDTFKRLNSGKISLSNAELVKALFLKDDNFQKINEDDTILKQIEMAGEWDRMEQTFHENSFWYFINPEPEDSRFNCTRIDFLLETILRCENNENNEPKYDIEKELRLNDYFIFSKYAEQINSFGWEILWDKVQITFRKMKALYDERQLYHYVGYLINMRGSDKFETLRQLLRDFEKMTNQTYLMNLKKRCCNTLGINDQNNIVRFDEWEYGKDNDKIHNVLLLFNLATTQNQISEVSRYPFDKHFDAAKKQWSLEHIHAQNERKAKWDKEQFIDIKNYLKNISVDGINELNEYLSNIKSGDDIDNDTYNAIIGAFMGIKVVKNIDKDGNISFLSEFKKDDHLTNLALLQGDKNASFNNDIYPKKRAKLAKLENVENESFFVPICTRNVFFKHYSPESNNPFVWDSQAGLDYVTAIVKVVASYLDIFPIIPNKENENKYGIQQN